MISQNAKLAYLMIMLSRINIVAVQGFTIVNTILFWRYCSELLIFSLKHIFLLSFALHLSNLGFTMNKSLSLPDPFGVPDTTLSKHSFLAIAADEKRPASWRIGSLLLLYSHIDSKTGAIYQG